MAAAIFVLPLAGSAQRARFSVPDLQRWLTHLASDELQGRQIFNEGLGLAGAYIAEQLGAAGVTPAGDESTYFQTVAITGARTQSRSNITVTANGRTRTFADGAGVTFPRNQGRPQTIVAPVEFVGYGLAYAPLNHDDYAGRDVKEKIALFIGRGGAGITAEHNRLVNARGRNAIEVHQAVASIGPVAPAPGRGRGAGPRGNAPAAPVPAGPETGRGGAPPAAPGNAAQRVDFQTAQSLDRLVPPQIIATDEFFEFLFSGSGVTYTELKALADKRQPLPSVALNDVRVTITVDAEYAAVQRRLSRNVVGLVRGRDARLRDSYIILGAHYDHVGYQQFAPAAGGRGGANLIAACAGQTRRTPRAGDIINNGADDNGSGTVALLAIAKAFAAGPKPRRSVLFVWHTGEEEGLYGSRYMADHPVVPLDRVVAMLNLDMVGRNRCDDPAEADTVYLVGSERISTELHNVNEEANASLPMPLQLDYEYNDPSDLESIYTRSDHYSYAMKGVPVIFFTTGLHRDYHFVTDEVDRIEFGKMARIAELVYTTAMRVANLERAPERDFAGPRVGRGRSGPLVAPRGAR